MTFLYIIHFDAAYYHAEHYVGCTTNIRKRLIDHAKGDAARLTQVLWEIQREWTLAALFTSEDNEYLWQAEQIVKKQHGTRPYCPMCNEQPRSVPTPACSYPIGSLPFPIHSSELRELT